MNNRGVYMSAKWRIVAGITVLFILFGGVVWLAWPGRQQAAVNGKVNVVAAENFWGDIAAQLGGSHVHVISIITDPNTDPHLYESSAQNASAVADAQVVMVNGLGYDDFMTKLISGSPNTQRTVLTAADILSASDGSNQHLWYDIPNVPKVASKRPGTQS
jgi:zinc/manganese transport system substrate-binding protein